MKTLIVISIIGFLIGGIAGLLLTSTMQYLSTTETYVRSAPKQIDKQSSKDGRYVACLLETKQHKIKNTNYQSVVIYTVLDLKYNTSVAVECFRTAEKDAIHPQLTWENGNTVKFGSNTEHVKNITMHFGADRPSGRKEKDDKPYHP
jgi:hypothetical protein